MADHALVLHPLDLAVGVLGGRFLVVARRLGWTSSSSEQLVVLAFSLLAYVGAVAINVLAPNV